MPKAEREKKKKAASPRYAYDEKGEAIDNTFMTVETDANGAEQETTVYRKPKRKKMGRGATGSTRG